MTRVDGTATQAASGQAGTDWDASRASSAYCNVASAVATPEAVVLNLGQTQGGARAQSEVTVELLQRVVLSPRTAKNLHLLLNRVIAEHDAHGGGTPR